MGRAGPHTIFKMKLRSEPAANDRSISLYRDADDREAHPDPNIDALRRTPLATLKPEGR